MKSIAFALLCLCVLGCRSEPVAVSDASFPTRNTYNVPPKVLLDKVKQVVTSPPVSLAIDTEQEGRIVTSWQSNPGATVGVGSVGRHWQERTRYTITVAPSWDDPGNKSTVEVVEETQQRPHEHWEWGSQDPVKRPERAVELARSIDSELARGTKPQPATSP